MLVVSITAIRVEISVDSFMQENGYEVRLMRQRCSRDIRAVLGVQAHCNRRISIIDSGVLEMPGGTDGRGFLR